MWRVEPNKSVSLVILFCKEPKVGVWAVGPSPFVLYSWCIANDKTKMLSGHWTRAHRFRYSFCNGNNIHLMQSGECTRNQQLLFDFLFEMTWIWYLEGLEGAPEPMRFLFRFVFEIRNISEMWRVDSLPLGESLILFGPVQQGPLSMLSHPHK